MAKAGGTGVTSGQFASTALRWLSPADFPAAAWAEQVQAPDRAAYERRTHRPIATPRDPNRGAPPSSAYLPATLVSGFAPLGVPGVDLNREPGIAAALTRALSPSSVAATPITGPSGRPSGLFLVAPATNLIDGVLRPGGVVVFVPEVTLRAAAGNPPGLRLVSAGRSSGADAGGPTVHKRLTVAGQDFVVVMPTETVSGPAAAVPWIVLAAGLLLSILAAGLGVSAGRRAKAQAEVDRIFNLSSDLITVADFQGRFKLANGRLELPELTFSVPGAGVQLAGVYGLTTETMDFTGKLLLDAKISQTVTGFKSVLLKAVDPLFTQKDGTGSAIPIRIGGTRSAPAFGLDVKKVMKKGD